MDALRPLDLSVLISGMHCAACVRNVERALQRVPGVLKADVLLTENRAQLSLAPGWQAALLVQALQEAGYEAPLTQATLQIDGLHDSPQAERLQSALQAVPGVVSVNVNLALSSARIQALPATEAQALVDAALKVGFRAGLKTTQTDDPLAREQALLRRDLAIAWLATLPLLAPMLLMPLGVHAAWPPLVQALLAGAVQFGPPGWRLYRAAWAGLKARTPGMDLLVAIGSSAAFGLSAWLWSRGASGHALFFESGAAIVAFVLLGRWLEARAKRATGGALRELQAMTPTTVELHRNGQWQTLPLAKLQVGDTVRLKPGQRVPCDGVLTAGRTHVNEAHLSGEPLPVTREVGQPLRAGSLNLDGAIELKATALPAASSLAQLVRLVETAQASKAPIQRLADTWSARFVPAVLGLSLLTLAGWLLAGAGSNALLYAVAVLVVACPCALGLATPAAVVVGIGQAALRGLVVRDAGALETLAGVRRMAFDKTGTLTLGQPQLVQVEAVAPLSRLEAQALASALAQGSEHPLARALLRAQDGVPTVVAINARAHAGLGVQADVEGRQMHMGSSRYMAELGVSTGGLEASSLALAARGCSISWVATTTPQPALLGLLAFADAPRPEAQEALARLKRQGLTLSLLSGDRPESAQAVGAALGIAPEEVHGGLLPADKLSSLAAWRVRGERVAMVGDGLNDAPALAAADVGIAMAPPGQGTDVAAQAAGLTLLKPDLRRIADGVALARATLRVIRQNLVWAFGFNAVMIPLAMAGRLEPMWAAAAMAGSSLMVVGNALRLRRWRP